MPSKIRVVRARSFQGLAASRLKDEVHVGPTIFEFLNIVL